MYKKKQIVSDKVSFKDIQQLALYLINVSTSLFLLNDQIYCIYCKNKGLDI